MEDEQSLPHLSDRMPNWLFCSLVVVFYLTAYPVYLLLHWSRYWLPDLQSLLGTHVVWWRLAVFESLLPVKQFVSAIMLWMMLGVYQGPGVQPSILPEGQDVQDLD